MANFAQISGSANARRSCDNRFTMRRQNPDALTAREREVLALIRLGLTNEEIARRLGITLDGAKYHVSQILSKLAVATREEAAAASAKAGKPALREERGAWWARWPLWAKISGGATVAATIGGLALLAWGVVRTASNAEEQDIPTLDPAVGELYDRVRQAMNRPGFVLHTTSEGVTLGSDDPPNDWVELWIDGANNVARRRLNVDDPSRPDGLIGIYQEEEWFSLMDSGRVGRFEVDAPLLCAGSNDVILALLLECNRGFIRDMQVSEPEVTPPYIEVPAIVLGAVEADESEGQQFFRSYRVYIDRETFLPIALTEGIEGTVPFAFMALLRYHHEFLPRDSLPADFFEPESLESLVE